MSILYRQSIYIFFFNLKFDNVIPIALFLSIHITYSLLSYD